MVFDFCDGGAADELTRGRNEAAFADSALLPQPLNGTAQRVPVGRAVRSAPGAAGDHRPDRAGRHALAARARLAAASAAASAGTVYAMSHGSTITIEDLARPPPGPLWFQIFMYRDRGLTRALAERAQAAGYQALVLTVDNQMLGRASAIFATAS